VEHDTPRALGFLDNALAEAGRSGLFRERPAPRDADPVSFCSNDYLGLASRLAPAFPCGAGASRLVAGDRRVHAMLEEAAAELVLQPASLVFASGYAANTGLLAALAGPGDLIVSDALNHASIIDGARLSRARIAVVSHLDVGAVARALESNRHGRAFVVTESYFSMDADAPDLAALRRLCDTHGAALIVDEAHALGVLGAEGRGLCAEAGVRADAIVGTFGKAFGAAGAFVAGCASLASWLWNRARPFVFSTGLSPMVAGAALDGIRRSRQEAWRRERVLQAAARLREGLRALGADLRGFGHVIPWVIGDTEAAMGFAEALRGAGMDVRAIRPPSVPVGTARLRLTVTASHGADDVERALAIAAQVRGGPGVHPVAETVGVTRSSVVAPGPAEAERETRRSRVVVIAGTGTSVGKTHLAEAMIRAWRRMEPSARVAGLKPVESGVADEARSDAARLDSAASFHVKQFRYALAAPVSPHLAARDEGIDIQVDQIAAFVAATRGQADGIVLELAGGLFTPLARGTCNADLAAALAPAFVIVVAPDRLGVLHDLGATARAAAAAGLRLHGAVLMAPEHGDASTKRNASEVMDASGVPVLAVLGRASSTELSELPALTGLLRAVRDAQLG
jgi:8-amino-7-oxononanoate synthase